MKTLGQLTPVFLEKKTGDDLAPQVEKIHGGVSTDSSLNNYITTVGERLRQYSPRAKYQHKFQVLNDAKVVNAFALGNGNVYVTQGLLNILDDEAELAAVMGHEIGHVSHRHIAQAIDTNIGTNLLVDLATDVFGGGNSERTEKLKEVGRGMVVSGFGRERELEADDVGLGYAVRAGYDPKGAIRFFSKLKLLEDKKAKGDGNQIIPNLQQFLRSHPTADKRIGELEADIAVRYPNAPTFRNRDAYRKVVFGLDPGDQGGGLTPAVVRKKSGGSNLLGLILPVGIVLGVVTFIGFILYDRSKA